MKYITTSAMLGLLLISSVVHSAILFDNNTVVDSSNSTWNDTYFSFTIYDDFQLSANSTITDINYSIFIQNSFDYTQTFISLLDGIGGFTILGPFASVGTLTSNGLTTSNANFPNGFNVTLSGLNISIVAGNYALGLSTDMNSGPFASAIGSGDSGFGSSLVQNNTLRAEHMAFSIEGTSAMVPEPSIIALFAAGLFGLGLVRRRKYS